MIARALQSVYWPGFRKDIEDTRKRCQSCNLYAPSNPSMPLIAEPDMPEFPFQMVCSDFMEWQGHSYLVMVDKYSNWVSLFKLKKDDSKNLIQALRMYFSTFGVPQIFCTDGAKVYTSSEMEKFYRIWGIKHRTSSAYYPAANKRAEVAVKSAKRIIRDNVGPAGTLNTNKVMQALLAHRNSPDPSTNVSPAQIVFGRPIRDIIPQQSYVPDRPWVEMAKAREKSFFRRHYSRAESDIHRKFLPPLQVGDSVYLQDQTGRTPLKWSKSGTVVECLPYDSYVIKVDGSRHVTKRNRRFLRKFTSFVPADPPPKLDEESAPRRSTRLQLLKSEVQESPSAASISSFVHSLVDSPYVVLAASVMQTLPAPSNLLLTESSTPWGASGTPSF